MSFQLSYRRIIYWYPVWWIIWTIVQTYIIHYLGYSYLISFIDGAISNLLLALIGVALYNIMQFYRPENENAFYPRIWVVLLTVFCSLFSNWMLHKLSIGDVKYSEFLSLALPIRFAYNFLMLAFISLGIWMLFYFKNIQEISERKTEAENLAREAELTGLRQQLQPHFLFNSLNSISALAGTKPEEARKMIQQLSDFLRGTLKKDDQHFVTLKEEFEHLNLYLEIEKVRFGHRMNTVVESNEKSLTMKLPSLLLQPIVENAIKFGLYDTTGNITIQIIAETSEDNLIITVKNPFDPETSQPQSGTGFGLNSVQRRLFLLFSRNDLLQTTNEKNIFITQVNIPQL